jgi:4-carboxymuconolactone decarboxylase
MTTDSKPPVTTAARQMFGDIAPKFAELSDELLFGDVWERPGLSKRDRSLITCAVLVATGKSEQINSHFPRALGNGVTQDELIEMITHVAFYAGWPSAVSAVLRARDIFAAKKA